jgi:hypothetical protein
VVQRFRGGSAGDCAGAEDEVQRCRGAEVKRCRGLVQRFSRGGCADDCARGADVVHGAEV